MANRKPRLWGWIPSPSSNRTPLQLMASQAAAEQSRQQIHKISHGGWSSSRP